MSIVARIGSREWRGIRSVSVNDLEVHSSLRLVMMNGVEGLICQDTSGAFIVDVGNGLIEHVPGTLLFVSEEP